MAARFACLLAGLWAGVLACIGAMAAPIAFATLATAEAARVAGRLFAQEAYLSLAVALVLYVIERQRSRDAAAAGIGSVLSTNIVLLFGTLVCTVGGYFALQPMMAAARAGQGGWSFATLHIVAAALYALKGVLVLVLAWRLSAVRTAATPS